MSSSPTSVSEYDAITEIVQQYIDSARSGSGGDMKAAFHEDATIFGYVGDDLFAGPIQQLFDWNDSNGPAAELRARIARIDLVDTAATVQLELENWTGHRFTDLFTLLKFDGKWKITNKVFHLHGEAVTAASPST
jgi:Putative lumazine-binding